jgi:hypothetical protein
MLLFLKWSSLNIKKLELILSFDSFWSSFKEFNKTIFSLLLIKYDFDEKLLIFISFFFISSDSKSNKSSVSLFHIFVLITNDLFIY